MTFARTQIAASMRTGLTVLVHGRAIRGDSARLIQIGAVRQGGCVQLGYVFSGCAGLVGTARFACAGNS
jgi:hypothetical protein